MNTHADKTQENTMPVGRQESQSVANAVSQKQSSSESAFQFVDNRPEAVAQRKLQEMANNSTQTKQLRAIQEIANNSPQSKQAAQLQAMAVNYSAKQQQPIQKKENNTGLPDNLKSGIENLSGYSMDDVKVHYNSDKPAQLQAHAFAQGTDIHLGSGQERHLPHEAWHVVQQKQGRVKPTMQMKAKVNINDDVGLEKEADVMGGKALQNFQLQPKECNSESNVHSPLIDIIQRKIGFEFEIGAVATQKNPSHGEEEEDWVPHSKGEVLSNQTNYDITADINSNGSQLEFVTKPLNENNDGDLAKLTQIAKDIPVDLLHIAYFANQNNGIAILSTINRFSGDQWNRFIPSILNWKNMAGQLQMTGGVKIESLPSVMSGTAMPESDTTTASGTDAQDLAINYQPKVPGTEDIQQPIYQQALVECKKFQHLDGRQIQDEAAEIMASILTLMSQIPLNARGLLTMEGQGKFLARTDYAKILQLLCQHSEILIDGSSFTRAMLSILNHYSEDAVGENDSVFPEDYQAAGQSFTEVTIKEWAESVLPSLGFLWGYWQGKDLISKKNFPGTQAQKNELRPFGEFGSKTDPDNKVILEWRNLQMMYPDQLELAMTGLADYLKNLNNT